MSVSASVIIATRNRRTLLAQTLAVLSRQTCPAVDFEVLVADNGSTDETCDVVADAASKAGPVVHYLKVMTPGKSFAVNAALKRAHGDVLAFIDDDVRPEPDWLSRLSSALVRPGVDFVAGRVQPIWEIPPPRWMSPALYGVLAVPDNGDQPVAITTSASDVVPIGANMAVRRAVIDRIGGLRTDLGKLDGTLRTGEDHEFFLRMLHAGFRGVYEPRAIVHHWVPAQRLERRYFQQWLYQNGRDVARLETLYPESRRVLGIPRYRWRQAAGDISALAGSMLGGSAAARFAAASRLRWNAGYLRESWWGAPQRSVAN